MTLTSNYARIYILGLARHAADKAKWTKEQWITFRDQATSGDHDQLLFTVRKYFDVS